MNATPIQSGPLDEKSLRSASFTEGPRVVLGDGQSWTFPAPRPLIFPSFADADGNPLDPTAKVGDLGPGERAVGLGFRMGYGQAHRARLDEIAAAQSPFEATCLILALAVEVLGRNYDLTPAEFAELLTYDEGDEASVAMLGELIPVLACRPTSPSAGANPDA